MNLSPRWVGVLDEAGFSAAHWSAIGEPTASDDTILGYARDHEQVVFTHDLDFGVLLAKTRAVGPSVVQVRDADPSPEHIGGLVIAALNDHRPALEMGALVTVDGRRSRVRVLPLRP